jgi:serine protease AprX
MRIGFSEYIGMATGGLIAACVLTSAALSARPPVATASALLDQAMTTARAAEPLSDRIRDFLTKRDGHVVRAWVFFTDKGVTDKIGFERAAANVSLSERSLKRRAKVGLDKVVFADLPVRSEYVEQISALGAHYRRSSRWLNAATFEIPADKLDQIAALSFVSEIRPMMVFNGPIAPQDEPEAAPRTGEFSPADDQYGASTAQLTQINVLAAHLAGWTGSGVTLTILDTGFRKTHAAFAQHYAHNRVLGERDFIFHDNNTANENGDVVNQWDHGTYIWSVSAGEAYGHIYGPAYEANIILCKTEDVRSETQVEEDNWVAGLEYADSIGTDVITSSLGYKVFNSGTSYTYEDMDGQTATTSIAASTCDGLGIVLCNSMGNSGPTAGSLTAPADAFDILAVGNVNSAGAISSSSSRGPTYDGRTKPEVCARGTSTACASPGGDSSYTAASGTSLSTPLIAGAACLVIQAHPDWTPAEVREALKMTANRAATPDNTYGWGIIDVMAAIAWDPHPTCCVGETAGNLDESANGFVGMGDLTVMIDHLYISLTPLSCPAAGDLDLSGSPTPTNSDVTIADLQVLIDVLFISLAPLPFCP